MGVIDEMSKRRPNYIQVCGDIAIITIRKMNGNLSEHLFDACFLLKVVQHRWYEHSGYLSAGYRDSFGVLRQIPLSRFIFKECLGIDIPFGFIVDHIDNNKKNNIVTNLRIVTRSQNNLNVNYCRSNTGYRGISYYKKDGMFVVLMGKHRRAYRTFGEARRARDLYLRKMGI